MAGASATSAVATTPTPVAPIVKWAGGKSRLCSQLLPLLPPRAASLRHIEPFAGGAAMFFARAPRRAVLSDINAALIAVYEAVREDVERLIEALRALAAEHDGEGHYYRVRDLYNAARGEHSIAQSARFIYLNKTGFNGLHRVNRKGEFNVPAGRYTNPRILDAEGLRAASTRLRDTALRCASFESVADYAGARDFVYLDPPYAPRSATAAFTRYASGGFDVQDQRRLRGVFDELTRRGVRTMLSNSDTPSTRELYSAYDVHTVSARRSVSCRGATRGAVSELVVINYAPAPRRAG